MSSWGMGWFGGGAQKKKDAPKNAILQLRSTLDMLAKREKWLQTQADEQDAMARKYLATNKNAAKQALRRKKQHEHALEQTTQQMLTVEREISTIESANINKETLDAMKNASAAMKTIHNGMTVDKVDATMEDLRDQHAISEEIADALSQGAITTGLADDEELEDELESMQQEELDNKMLKTGATPIGDPAARLPTPAGGELTKQTEDDEEEELRKLQAEMAM